MLAVTTQRIPFHYGLFYNAMIGLIGRKPDHAVRLGDDGFYDFYYEPKDNLEARKLEGDGIILARWLDIFEIQFSGSRCEFGKPVPRQDGDEDVLQIRIRHPVEDIQK